MGITESSIVYGDTAPESVSAPVREALSAWADARWSEHHGDAACLVDAASWVDVHTALKGAGLDWLVDLSAVDYPEREPRFTVVTVVQNMATQERLIVKTRVADRAPVASLTPLWSSANWAEREAYDMFGIPFEGHPNLTRIYMPEDYDGWPLRRDFPLQGHLRFRD